MKNLSGVKIVVCPAMAHLGLIDPNETKFEWGAQNVSAFPQGAYTGEVAAEQLKDLGIKWCLVGHSERREWQRETANDIAKKISELFAVGIEAIVGIDDESYVRQLAVLDEKIAEKCWWMYEPKGAIGTGKAAELERVKEMADHLRKLGVKKVLYGGSVDKKNLDEFLKLKEIDGLVIGGASLNSDEWNRIIQETTG